MFVLNWIRLKEQFFSEEKNQKTFTLDAIRNLSAPGPNRAASVKKKVFWFFFQKRTASFLKTLAVVLSHPPARFQSSAAGRRYFAAAPVTRHTQ